MHRRNFLRCSTAIGCILVDPGLLFSAVLPQSISGVYPFQVGKFKCYSINDGVWPDATLDFLFSGAPSPILAQKAEEYHLPQSHIEIPLNFLLIDTQEELILVDTGYGEIARERNDPAGYLPDRLTELGINPDQINKVVITHQHPDHLGGVIDKNGDVRFPNATFYMDPLEYESLKNDTGWAGQRISRIASRLEMIQDTEFIIPGIQVLKSYGHTPGHIHLMIESEGQKMLYTSDTFGHELHLEYPDWSMGHEYSREIAAKVRREVINNALREDLTLFSCHLPFPGIGRVRKMGDRTKWIPTRNE